MFEVGSFCETVDLIPSRVNFVVGVRISLISVRNHFEDSEIIFGV